MKPKFDRRTFLIITQLIEIITSETKPEQANELADLASICIREIRRLGYDPAVILASRLNGNARRVTEIADEYERAFRRLRRQLK